MLKTFFFATFCKLLRLKNNLMYITLWIVLDIATKFFINENTVYLKRVNNLLNLFENAIMIFVFMIMVKSMIIIHTG